MEKVTLAEQGTPLLRHIHCTQCAGESHFLWNPAQEQYLCLRCRGVLFSDQRSGAFATQENTALDSTKAWTPPTVPERYHEHLQQARYMGNRSDSEPE